MNKQYINIQTKEVLDMNKVSELKDNSLLKNRPDLFEFWNFEKNNELGVDIYKVSKGTATKAWWICDGCPETYDTTIDKKTSQNAKCPYCRGLRVGKYNNLKATHPHLAKLWDYDKNGDMNPEQFVKGSKQKVFWKCSTCGEEAYGMIASKENCQVCSGQKARKGFNDIWAVNPELGKLLLNKEDGYKYMCQSNKKVNWKCNICDNIINNRLISDVNNRGLNCSICSDSLSFGERAIYSLLSSNNIEFIHELSFKWSEGKRYDFYIPDSSMIIEVHGEQHYNGSFSKIGGRTLEEEQENDRYKEQLAKDNGIEHYIKLKSKSMKINELKEEIKRSLFPEILKLEDSDIDNLSVVINNNLVTKCWDYWNSNNTITISDLSRDLNINIHTAKKYLSLGNELNKCKYPKNKRVS